MTTLKSLTIAAALLVSGTSLAMAQNGQPTGAYPPVAGGAGGNPITNPGYYGGYYSTGGYIAAPGYVVPGYVGAEEPSAEPGYVVAPHRMYMYVPPHRTSHHKKIAPAANEQ
jgi:hypothetical protein